jgi:hypothetical protein
MVYFNFVVFSYFFTVLILLFNKKYNSKLIQCDGLSYKFENHARLGCNIARNFYRGQHNLSTKFNHKIPISIISASQ